MLKSLAIVGVLLGCMGWAWSQIPRDGGHQHKETEQANSQSNPTPSAIEPPHRDPSTSNQKQQSSPESSKYPWKELYGPANIPNWCLVLVGGLAAGFAYWTLKNISMQTNQLRRQSDLLGKQIETQIERERARLVLEPQPIEIPENRFDDGVNLRSCIELTNSGHSNAFIKFGAVRFVLVGFGLRTLSGANPDDFTPMSNTIEPSKEAVYCPLWSDEIPLRIKEFAEDLAEGKRSIYLHGFVEYETLGIKWHRDFGYVWKIAEPARVPPDPATVIFKHPTNPETLCLTGWWEQDLSQKNSEYR